MKVLFSPTTIFRTTVLVDTCDRIRSTLSPRGILVDNPPTFSLTPKKGNESYRFWREGGRGWIFVTPATKVLL